MGSPEADCAAAEVVGTPESAFEELTGPLQGWKRKKARPHVLDAELWPTAVRVYLVSRRGFPGRQVSVGRGAECSALLFRDGNCDSQGPCATIERCVSAIVGVTRLKQSQAWGARTGLPSDVMDTLHMHSDARCWMSSNPLLRRHGSRACPPDGRPGRMWCGKCSELEKIAKHGILCSAGHAVAPSRAGVRRWEMGSGKKGGTPKRKDVTFVAPDGEEIKTKRQLDKYLKAHPGTLSAGDFEWGVAADEKVEENGKDKEETKAMDVDVPGEEVAAVEKTVEATTEGSSEKAEDVKVESGESNGGKSAEVPAEASMKDGEESKAAEEAARNGDAEKSSNGEGGEKVKDAVVGMAEGSTEGVEEVTKAEKVEVGAAAPEAVA
uniref:MBD domain-containing protein n=1 Tax=Physcomitrium patens TaxID=3218 RepID=A0A2K1JXX3_PHYPA|nr:hypothetical protein PHYPA_013493 [Physcomitrium patens]